MFLTGSVGEGLCCAYFFAYVRNFHDSLQHIYGLQSLCSLSSTYVELQRQPSVCFVQDEAQDVVIPVLAVLTSKCTICRSISVPSDAQETDDRKAVETSPIFSHLSALFWSPPTPWINIWFFSSKCSSVFTREALHCLSVVWCWSYFFCVCVEFELPTAVGKRWWWVFKQLTGNFRVGKISLLIWEFTSSHLTDCQFQCKDFGSLHWIEWTASLKHTTGDWFRDQASWTAHRLIGIRRPFNIKYAWYLRFNIRTILVKL